MSITLLAVALYGTGHALTAEALAEALLRGDRITVIDLRHPGVYQRAHIPGAINIPTRTLVRKRLPALGRVVIYGDGIKVNETQAALEALGAKAGIEAEILDGGFPAWEAAPGQPIAQKTGVERAWAPMISHKQLTEIAETHPDLVLVDLRGQDAQKSNLARVFPRAERLVRFAGRPYRSGQPGEMERVLKAIVRRSDAKAGKLFVLIDHRDGVAERLAWRLHTAGVRRVMVLAGGEDVLVNQGQQGVGKRVTTP